MRQIAGFLALGIILATPLATPARAEDAWTGKWDTTWPDGSARIELRQHGASVEGSYRLYDGHLAGTAAGNRLEGEWTEGARHGHFLFVLGPFQEAFTGRFDGDAWWTGARTSRHEVRPAMLDATPQLALRSFIVAANLAAAGIPDAMADAMRVVDFGDEAEALDGQARLHRTKALFAAIDQTTFFTWALPDPSADQPAITYTLRQAGTDATLALTLVRLADGAWRIAVPPPDALAAATAALLKRSGGRPPPPDAPLDRRNPRDTMRDFVGGMLGWKDGGAARALDTMDLSQIREAYREDQGRLQAQYMMQVINRVGAWQWQEIPDDPASRTPHVFFTHEAGQIVLAPQGQGEATRWLFTPATVASQLRLFVVTSDMPPIAGIPVIAPASDLFALRTWIAGLSPLLLGRNLVPVLENWQIIAIIAAVTVVTLAIGFGVPLVIRLVGALLRALGQPVDPALERRLVWPLRLLAVTLIWFKLSRRLGLAGPYLPALDASMGVVAAVGIAWAGLPVVDAVARGLHGRVRQTPGTMDEILVSLTAGLLKLGLVVMVALAVAEAFDIPVAGLVAGLGIGGLAVAFASKETLSNLFGAAILLADRPFRNGDTIAVGDVQGTVEDVGIRSTRIRTMDDTVVVLPNGKLSDALINNFGARRYRLFRTKFSIGYGATMEQLEAFTARLRDLLVSEPSVAEEKTQVGLWQLNADGIEIDLVCYFRAQSAAEERAARHDLLLKIMRLAGESGLGFNRA